MNQESSHIVRMLAAGAESAFARTPVLFAYLYGSRAKKAGRPDSDYDIAVYYRPGRALSTADELRLSINLEKAAGLKPIDLREINIRPLAFQGAVIHNGIVIYSVDEDARIEFERKTLHMYLDFLPTLKRFDRRFHQAVCQEGIL